MGNSSADYVAVFKIFGSRAMNRKGTKKTCNVIDGVITQ